jgi:multidrug resistance efflux pump
MADDSWKDARVRQAEAALALAVRTADEIIADVQGAAAEPEPPAREEPPDDEPPSILRDAW